MAMALPVPAGQDPDAATAASIAQAFDGTPPQSVHRFTTGDQHFVYEVTLGGGRPVVVRLSRPEDSHLADAALGWSKLLRPRGVPLPKVLHHDLTQTQVPFPYMVLERLPGRDLGDVLPDLTPSALGRLAHDLYAIQQTVAALPAGRGYGFTLRPTGPFPHPTWADVLHADLERSRRRIASAGAGQAHTHEATLIERAADCLAGISGYLSDVPPTPFLHDITTKNVLVADATLSGIVDVDDLCYGDPLFHVALIRMALLAHGRDTSYADTWLHMTTPAAKHVERVYTLVHCVGFLSELDTRFNGPSAKPVSAAYRTHLQTLFESLSEACER